MVDRSGARRHTAPLALFAALAVAWTWPLAQHLSDAIPGDPGDNYGYLWNLWWMRHVRSTPGLEFFRTTFLFYPFGTTIADHPHTALPGFIAATALNGLSVHRTHAGRCGAPVPGPADDEHASAPLAPRGRGCGCG